MPHLAAVLPVSVKPPQSCRPSAGTDKPTVNTGAHEIYAAVDKVKGLPPSLNCMLIYFFYFFFSFLFLKF